MISTSKECRRINRECEESGLHTIRSPVTTTTKTSNNKRLRNSAIKMQIHYKEEAYHHHLFSVQTFLFSLVFGFFKFLYGSFENAKYHVMGCFVVAVWFPESFSISGQMVSSWRKEGDDKSYSLVFLDVSYSTLCPSIHMQWVMFINSVSFCFRAPFSNISSIKVRLRCHSE